MEVKREMEEILLFLRSEENENWRRETFPEQPRRDSTQGNYNFICRRLDGNNYGIRQMEKALGGW